jgi:hypothetical protein
LTLVPSPMFNGELSARKVVLMEEMNEQQV